MALAKKGSRSIIVQDVQYRWKVCSEPNYTKHLVVELYEHPQQSMVAFFREDKVTKEKVVINPAVVSSVIEYALKKGWSPFKKAPQLNLGFLDDFLKKPDNELKEEE